MQNMRMCNAKITRVHNSIPIDKNMMLKILDKFLNQAIVYDFRN